MNPWMKRGGGKEVFHTRG